MNLEQTFKEFLEDLPVELAIIAKNILYIFDNEGFNAIKWEQI